MIFHGEREMALGAPELWAKMRDLRFIVECIPDATPVGTPERDRALCQVRPGFAFARGTLDVTLEVTEAVENTSLRFLASGKGIGSSSDVETSLSFAAVDGGSRIQWQAEIKRLGGLLKAVPSGLIRGAAQKVIEDVWTAIVQKLGS